jgi:hypothetical protein
MLYILSCRGTSSLDKLIRFISGDEISHTAIQISDRIIVETGAFGVKMSPLSRLNNDFIRYEFIDISSTNENLLIEFILDSVSIRYDYKLMIALGLNKLFGLRLNWDNPTKYICTEIIIEACKKVLNIDLIPNIPDADIGPWDMKLSPYLREK